MNILSELKKIGRSLGVLPSRRKKRVSKFTKVKRLRKQASRLGVKVVSRNAKLYRPKKRRKTRYKKRSTRGRRR